MTASNVQRLTVGSAATDHSTGWNTAIGVGYPTITVADQQFIVLLHMFATAIGDIGTALAGNDFGGQQITVVVGTSNIDVLAIAIGTTMYGTRHNGIARGGNPRLRLYQHFVVFQFDLGATIGNVQTAMGGMDFTGSQTAGMMATSHIQGLTITGAANTQGMWWYRTEAGGDPDCNGVKEIEW